MGEKSKAQLKELLEAFDTAMLITRSGEKLHARPMAVAGVDGANIVWFATSIDSPKSEEIRKDSRASATFQGKLKFLAVSGEATIVRDRNKIDQLWQASWKSWFPKGKDDPSIALIRLTVSDAEVWDMGGLNAVRYVFEQAKAIFTGTTPEMTGDQHARLKDPAPVSERH